MDSKVFTCFVLMKDRYGLVLGSNILVSKKYSEGRTIAYCANWDTSEGAFIMPSFI